VIVIEIPEQYRRVADLVLMGLDPRHSEEHRAEFMLAAVEQSPEFVAGLLGSVVEDYHRRAEALRRLSPGHMVDQMRAKILGAEDVLGVAMHSARAGESVKVQVTNPDALGQAVLSGDSFFKREWLEGRGPEEPAVVHLRQPGETRFSTGGHIPDPEASSTGDTRVGTGPNGEWTVADAAMAGEQARRARQAAEFGSAAPPQGGRDQTGGQAVSEPLRAVSGDAAIPTPGGLDPRVAGLLRNLRAQRRDEAAIEQADLDDPRTMPAAMTAALDPVQLDDPESPTATPDGGNDQEVGLCGSLTGSGPCILGAGHPELPIPGTQNGHMSERMFHGE
jgi:hypothetical protein